MESLEEHTKEEEDVVFSPENNTTEIQANNALNEDLRNQTAAKQSYEQRDTSAYSMENVSETSLGTEITKPNICLLYTSPSPRDA